MYIAWIRTKNSGFRGSAVLNLLLRHHKFCLHTYDLNFLFPSFSNDLEPIESFSMVKIAQYNNWLKKMKPVIVYEYMYHIFPCK